MKKLLLSEGKLQTPWTLRKNKMGMILEPDDFKVGMKVTVHTGPMMLKLADGGMMGGAIAIAQEDRSGCGEILIIKAVMLPYIIVYKDGRYEHSNYVHKLDIRGRKFMRVTDEYAEALLDGKK